MINLPHLVIFTPKKCGTFTAHAVVERIHNQGLWSDEIRMRPLPIKVTDRPWHTRTLPDGKRTHDCKYIMLDRDPLDRFMSQYFFAKKMFTRGSSCWNGKLAGESFNAWTVAFFEARDLATKDWIKNLDWIKHGSSWSDFILTQEEYYRLINDDVFTKQRRFVHRIEVSDLYTALIPLCDERRLDELQVSCNKKLNKSPRAGDDEEKRMLDALPTELRDRVNEWCSNV